MPYVECKYLTQTISRLFGFDLLKFSLLTWKANGLVEHHVERRTFTDLSERTVTALDVIRAVHVVAAVHAQRGDIFSLRC